MTEYSSDYFSVAWLPIFPGAKHTIKLFEQNNFGQWIEIRNYSNVQGSSHTILNYSLTECKLEIYTNCPDGTFGSTPSVLFPKVILELLIPSVAPENPINLTNCSLILLDNYDWIGYRIREIEGGENDWNYFKVEVEPIGPWNSSDVIIKIRRVIDPTNVYGVDDQNNWPDIPNVPVYAENPTKFNKEIAGFSPFTIGHVRTTYLVNGKRQISFCNGHIPSKPWDPNFEFQVLGVPKPAPQPFLNWNGPKEEALNVENPFQGVLRVKLPVVVSNDEKLTLYLFSLDGNLKFEEMVQSSIQEITMNTSNLTSGIYILKVSTKNRTWTSKLFKL
ncbi:MAG: T9SS type A sorting domain-containing protein [Saprospiraceae bacterium]|nr:T9SS type A sorting domain-containing protein [Saprospiraceae bacterium]